MWNYAKHQETFQTEDLKYLWGQALFAPELIFDSLLVEMSQLIVINEITNTFVWFVSNVNLISYTNEALGGIINFFIILLMQEGLIPRCSNLCSLENIVRRRSERVESESKAPVNMCLEGFYFVRSNTLYL